jgi:spermidine/putrescine transport system ATP-binding protein
MTEQFQVELRGVTRRYDGAIGVRAIDLQVRRGEFFSLLGPSGCGKSTTLRLIAGFERPDEGEVRIAGRSMRGVPPYQRNIGIVFQSYALFPHLNVFENVAFGLRTRRIGGVHLKRQVERALAMVELEELARRKPHQLSGGQQQRVALARAVVIEPDVLLLDEPLGALDKKLREAMQVRLIELHRELGITTIYVTHDQEEALTMSDRIAVMSSQTHAVVQLDTPEMLYHRPQSRFVANFIGTSSEVRDRVRVVEDQLLVTERGLLARVEPGFAAAPGSEVALAVRPEKIALREEAEPDGAGRNRVVGLIETVVFLGESTTYLVRVDQDLFRVKQFHDVAQRRMAEGSRVTLTWWPEDTNVFSLAGESDVAPDGSRSEPIAAERERAGRPVVEGRRMPG